MLTDDDAMDSIAIGVPTKGVPMPRSDGFIGRLRRTLERLEVGMYVDLLNVGFKPEQHIRARLPALQADMQCKFRVNVETNKRNRTVKRTLRIWRLE